MGRFGNYLRSRFNVQVSSPSVGSAPLGQGLLTSAGAALGSKVSACCCAVILFILLSFLVTFLKIPFNIASKLF